MLPRVLIPLILVALFVAVTWVVRTRAERRERDHRLPRTGDGADSDGAERGGQFAPVSLSVTV